MRALVGARTVGLSCACALALLLGACGRVDEIREVFDTSVDNEDLLGQGTITTLPEFDFGTRFDPPQLLIVDDVVQYELDPALVTEDAISGTRTADPVTPNTATTATGPSTQGPEPQEPAVETLPLAEPGALTHVQIQIAPDASAADVEDIRRRIDDYLDASATAAELAESDLRPLLRVLYAGDAGFLDAASGRELAPLLLLSHRWPDESPDRVRVVRDLQALPAVEEVRALAEPAIHRSEIVVDASSDILVALPVATLGERGYLVQEGQHLVLFGQDGARLTSTIAPRDADFASGARLLLTDDPSLVRLEPVSANDPLRRRQDGCLPADRLGRVEVRTCSLASGEVTIEQSLAGGNWTVVTGAPSLPWGWDDTSPAGAVPPAAGWGAALIGPDSTRALVQWTGVCETEAAAIVDLTAGSVDWVESSTRRPWGPGVRALGWTRDGRVAVYLGHNTCDHSPTRLGLFIIDPNDELDPELVHPDAAGDGVPVVATSWRLAGN